MLVMWMRNLLYPFVSRHGSNNRSLLAGDAAKAKPPHELAFAVLAYDEKDDLSPVEVQEIMDIGKRFDNVSFPKNLREKKVQGRIFNSDKRSLQIVSSSIKDPHGHIDYCG